MRSFKPFALPALLTTLLALTAGAVAAQTLHPGGFPEAVGPVAERITHLYNVIFIIIAGVMLLVTAPVLYILWKFRRDKVSRPATFSHSTILEVGWTTLPALICFFIAWESYQAMVTIRTMPKDAVNVEVVAYQFGWDFYYQDASRNGTRVAVAEATAPDAFLSSAGQERLVKDLIVPVGKPVVLHVTAADVIHAVFVPNLGVKIDAIPGRINYAWFTATKPGSYLGQCAELCGAAHSEMFFRVTAVPEAEFNTYIRGRQVEAGIDPDAPVAGEVSPSLPSEGAPVAVQEVSTASAETSATTPSELNTVPVRVGPQTPAKVTPTSGMPVPQNTPDNATKPTPDAAPPAQQ